MSNEEINQMIQMIQEYDGFYRKMAVIEHLEDEMGYLSEEILSVFDFGSTYQNTNDEESDYDTAVVVVSSLYDLMYRKRFAKTKHLDHLDTRIIPLEHFIALIEKASFDSILMLNAQLEKGFMGLNEEVFGVFKKRGNYKHFVKGDMKRYLFSLGGNMKNFKNKLEERNMSGKDVVKAFTFLHHYEKALSGKIGGFDTFSKVTDDIKEDLVPMKRFTPEQMKDVDFEKVNFFNEKGINSYESMIQYIQEKDQEMFETAQNYQNDEDSALKKKIMMEQIKRNAINLYIRKHAELTDDYDKR